MTDSLDMPAVCKACHAYLEKLVKEHRKALPMPLQDAFIEALQRDCGPQHSLKLTQLALSRLTKFNHRCLGAQHSFKGDTCRSGHTAVCSKCRYCSTCDDSNN